VRITSLSLSFCILFLASAVFAGDIVRDEAGTAHLGLGTCVSGLGDQDGDGDDELLAGAPGYLGGDLGAGRVFLWFGGQDIALNADHTWEGSGVERFGQAVARIGDVNGDGRDDFAVGAPLSDATTNEGGRVYIYYGGTPLPASADLILESPSTGSRFGWAIAALGDLDGDDRDDFVVGAPWADGTGLEAGAAFVYYGDAGGPADTPDLALSGTLAYEHFGWAVAGVGEFLGGNSRCVAVGAPSNGTGAGTRQGAVYVFQGTTVSTPGPDAVVDLTLYSNASVTGDNEFGYSVAGAGSFNGDSVPDLVAGAPFCDQSGIERGRVEIFYGGTGADASADRYCTGPAANARLGWSVAGVGDVTGTSAPDVVMGAPFDDSLGNESGRAFIWPGGSGNVTDADNLDEVLRDGLVSAPAGDHFGVWCTGLGDFDGDGSDDFAVGAPSGNNSSSAVTGWVRFVDSSGTAVPVLLGGWACAWNQDGAAVGQANVSGLDGAELAGTQLVRRADGRDVVVDARHVAVSAGRLTVRDPDAAWQTQGPVNYSLTLLFADGGEVTLELTGPVGPRPDTAPRLFPAAPNPFNPATVLSWRAAEGTAVTVTILDVRGRRVRLLQGGLATGALQTARWDGRHDHGDRAAAGVYLVRFEAGARVLSERITLLP